MTTIAAVTAPTMSALVSPTVAREAATSAVPTPSRADQPAIINDVASRAASGISTVSSDDLPTTLRGKINRVIEDVSSYNSFAWLEKHITWGKMEAEFGTAKVEETKQRGSQFLEDLNLRISKDTTNLQSQTGGSGLSLTRKEDGSFAVSEFSFKDAGSTYTVKQGTDGRMIGLKDGQGWKTWQVELPTAGSWSRAGAETALATLTALASSNTGKIPTDLLV